MLSHSQSVLGRPIHWTTWLFLLVGKDFVTAAPRERQLQVCIRALQEPSVTPMFHVAFLMLPFLSSFLLIRPRQQNKILRDSLAFSTSSDRAIQCKGSIELFPLALEISPAQSYRLTWSSVQRKLKKLCVSMGFRSLWVIIQTTYWKILKTYE